MALYTAEIGTATGFAPGPTVRDMYKVAASLVAADSVDITKVRIVCSAGSLEVPRVFSDMSELEHHVKYARDRDREYFPLDQRGIAQLIHLIGAAMAALNILMDAPLFKLANLIGVDPTFISIRP